MKNNPMLKLMVQAVCFWLLVVFFISFFTSCGATKHKETRKEEVKIELSENDKSKNETSKDTVSKKQTAHKKEVVSKIKAVVYQGKKGDSLTVTEENLVTGEKKKTTYHGSGTLSETIKEESLKEALKTTEENIGKSSSKSEKENNIKLKASTSSLETIKEKKTSYCWLWLLIVIVVAALAWYLNKRFKLFFQLSNYVTRVFNR